MLTPLATDYFSEPAAQVLALKWISREARARILIDDHMRLLWANSGAQTLLEDGFVLALHAGRLKADSAATYDKLVDFIQNCGSTVSILLLPSKKGGHLILRSQLLGREGERHFFGVQLSRTSQYQPEYVDLSAAFGLTQAEHRMIMQLMRGQTADEIAALEGIAIGTVRTHIRHIYEKLNVTSREALFRVVGPYQL
ncbi:helix-turn-helix transcriptional regulator [Sphingomonas hengshuiensis]|uniref:HTH luxR-type domain-containing protein n=1 Tax=Sphingomonas hengshuiensis TaxID=1609977 RepID=A0A7U4LH75_9SPHN|nr:helix-turn-helix transcriptional regulator [Sphingomonas hengshuiensis]AJP73889.1 hypothetical protein TS85_21945 [Sphingomonas hengshuiensis]